MIDNPIRGITCSLLLTALLLFPPARNCPAEPAAPIKYLMNEPVSMLDWGIYRMGNALRTAGYLEFLAINDIRPNIHARYEPSFNSIVIEVTSPIIEDVESRKKAREWCSSVVELSRVNLGVNKGTGKASSAQGSHIRNFFQSEWHQKTDQPESLGNELDKITELIVFAKFREKGAKAPPRTIRCNAPLLGTGITFSE